MAARTVVLLRLAGLATALAAATALPVSAADEWLTTSTLVGTSKYEAGFPHYDYVNPNAPKGGRVNAALIGTFDSFNPYIVRGSAAAGLASFGGGLLYDTLMDQATDEPSTSHPLIADAFRHPDDYSSAVYRIDPRAKFQDGKPITVDDVIWSFNALKEHSQLYNQYYANVTEAVAISDREVEFRFDQKGNRELPHIMGDLPVLPKHWWEGTDPSGKKRDITQPTLEPPLGSGPYRIKSFVPGSEIVWERVPDYWATSVPVKVGRENFAERRFFYFLDDTAEWQAFTKGGFEDFRGENRAKRWATEYNFPAFEAGDVKKAEFATTSGEPMQGFALNLRRQKFQDRRVRMALNYAFDFESMNRTLFYEFYTRTDSYFEGGELASSGLPEGRELEILNAYRDKLPPELFTEPFKLPVHDSQQATREHLRKAFELLKEAGWENRDGRLVDAKSGEPFSIEFLADDPTDERFTAPFINNLKRLGIDASLRVVDPSQYVNRARAYDYDVIMVVLNQSQSPGNEQRDFWSSAAADAPNSRNAMGIKDPVVDALVDGVIFAGDRDELLAATHALDRVLLWNYYIVPHWHLPKVWVAYWDKFGIPDKQPSYAGVDFDSWWIDPAKEAALQSKYRGTSQ